MRNCSIRHGSIATVTKAVGGQCCDGAGLPAGLEAVEQG